MVAKRKNPIDELFDQFMEELFKMAEFITGEARVKVERAGGASLSKEERGGGAELNEKLKCDDEKTESFLVVPICKGEQTGTEVPKRTRKRRRVKMVEGDLFGG